jgi:gas vesicle protein
MRRMALTAGAGVALGWLAGFFLDPESGKRRRRLVVDRPTGFLKQKAAHLRKQPKEQTNDATLAAKVESELFRPADIPKGNIDVNAEDGVVYLRGEVDSPELMDELEEQARRIQGVRGVENLLHLPGQPAPMHH